MPCPGARRNSCLPDINLEEPRLLVLLDIDVYWEMGIHVAHFVPETFRDPNDQVVNEGFDSTECSDILSCTMVKFDDDGIFAAL